MLVFVFLCMFYTTESYAEPLPELTISDQQKVSCAFIQPSIPIYLYKNVPLTTAIDVSKLKKNLIAHARNHPYLEVVSDDMINKQLLNSGEYNDVLMQAEIDMGYSDNQMTNANYVLATTLIQRVIQNYTQLQLAYFRPNTVARAYQMLAYAYIAQFSEETSGSLDLPHLARTAFIELIRLAPHITMLEGRQSPDRVQTYDEALELFMGSESYRQTPQRDAIALAHRLNVDMLVFTRIVQQKNGSLQLEIDLLQNGEMHYQTLPIEFSPTDTNDQVTQKVLHTATAWLSNQYDCLDIPQIEPEEPALRRFSIAVGPTYSLYLTHPTADVLHGVGAWVNFSFMFNQYLFVRAGMDIAAILPDKAHELYDNFIAYRIPLQFGMALTLHYFRLFFAIGAELSFTSEYTITKSIACKTFGTNDIECDQASVIHNRDPFALQMPLNLGVDFSFDPFYITFETFLSATVYPAKKNVFRNPFGLRAGLGYRF